MSTTLKAIKAIIYLKDQISIYEDLLVTIEKINTNNPDNEVASLISKEVKNAKEKIHKI